jgi:hypothetical protein
MWLAEKHCMCELELRDATHITYLGHFQALRGSAYSPAVTSVHGVLNPETYAKLSAEPTFELRDTRYCKDEGKLHRGDCVMIPFEARSLLAFCGCDWARWLHLLSLIMKIIAV